MLLNVNKAEFVKSAASAHDFIHDGKPCVVFAGKSNVGKSSVINSLLRRKNFARVGAAPGKTVHVNYFLIGDYCWFVDLPGYGYAKVSQSEKERWGRLMEAFFAEQANITYGIQIVDARHKPTELDVMMNGLFDSCDCRRAVVANKLDKLKKSEIEPNMQCIRETMSLGDSVLLLPYSAEKGTGRETLLQAITEVVL